ncbi:efflux RND transporter periplasmic adaptor subunit, partial [Myxococcota bacterium]|nr:efflux RND transporter periplasmic adaptor subunit [Myxococcota bacterium]
MKHLILLTITSLIIFAGCKGPKSKRKIKKIEKPASLVGVVTTKTQVFTPTINTVGYAQPFKMVTLSVERAGKLVYLLGEVGEFLPANRLVARVRSLGLYSQRSGAEARITEIQTALSQAKRDFEKIAGLRKKGVVSQNDYEMAELQLKTRRAQLNSASASLSQVNENLYGTSVFAQFSGEIAARYQELGNFVNMGTPLIQLVDLHKIKVNIGVSEITVTRLKVGDPVLITTIAFPGRIWKARINSLAPAADAKSGTFSVEMIFDNSPDKSAPPLKTAGGDPPREPLENWPGPWLIKSGMTLKTRFFMPSLKGIFIPVESIIERAGKKWVYVVQKPVMDKKTTSSVTLREVILGLGFEGWYEVAKGLVEGDVVVVTGSGRLRKDSRVRLIDSGRSIQKE